MQAVRLYAAGDLRVETIDMAAMPGPSEVRLRVAYAGLCGSDLHNFKTGQWISRSPSVAGHELSGWVNAVGPDVEHVAPDDAVAVDSRYYCGTCANCSDGKANLCEKLGFVGEAIDGGFATYVTLPAKLVLKANRSDAMDVLALAEPLAVALHAIARLNLPDDASLLVVGCGPIGALAALVASMESDRAILTADRNAARLEAVSEMTGAQALPPQSDMPPFDPQGHPLRYVLDTTGSTALISSLLDRLSGATIGLVGIGSGQLSLDPVLLVEKELSLIGCHAYEDELPKAVALLKAHPDRFRPIIGQVTPLTDALSAYSEAMAGNTRSIKTLFDIAGPTQ
jgi:(R,R)-butanediol dehydrogenase/meso-butanediol dehydrogenase/diacetyl reductase